MKTLLLQFVLGQTIERLDYINGSEITDEKLFLIAAKTMWENITGYKRKIKDENCIFSYFTCLDEEQRVQLAHDLGIGISYKDVLGLHDSWALRELQENNAGPGEIAKKTSWYSNNR